MDYEFVAITPQELLAGIGSQLCAGRVSKTVANERVQMMHLLKALAATPVLQYPITVRQTSDRVPDFQLTMGTRRVGVELTRIGFQDLEHGRALQARGLKRTVSASALLPRAGGPRSRKEVIQDGFGVKPFVFPLSVEEESRVWGEGAKSSLEAKTAVLARKDFAHGDEDWLVIVDSAGEVPEEAQGRLGGFLWVVAGFWVPGWFSRVFLQDNFYRWQAMFTASGYSVLTIA